MNTLFVITLSILLTGCLEQPLDDLANGSTKKDPPPPAPISVTGIDNDSLAVNSKTWTWGCNKASCEYRHVINQNASFTFTSESFNTTISNSISSPDGTYFIHVQAREVSNTQISSKVMGTVTIDNTNPTDPSGLILNGDATETSSDTLSWTASTDLNLSHYEFSVGTTTGGEEVVAWKSIGNVTTHSELGLSLIDSIDYFISIRAVDEAGNTSAAVHSIAWRIPGPPGGVANLSLSNASPNSITLGWTKPFDNGSPISDYHIEYKPTAELTWDTFIDGVSLDTTATVTGLTESTSYDFRVRAYNGTTGAYSNVATGETTVDDPFFDPTVYKAMNLGGATASAVAAMEDNTEIELNGAPLVTLNAGETHSFASALNDIVSADKPIFVAGKKGTSTDVKKVGNIVWNTPDWAGKDFVFTATRESPAIITIYAFEDADVEIYQGATLRDSASVLSGANHTFSIPQYGGFNMTSDGLIIAYMYSAGSGGDGVADPKPLLPASTDIIGFPSSKLMLTALNSSTSYDLHHSNGVTSSSTLTAGVATSINPQGTSSLYQSQALRVVSSDKVVGNSNADSNGYCSAPFLPVSMMKKRYVLNVEAEWVAFASLEPGDITVTDPSDGSTTTLTLTQSGSNPNAPYKVRTTNKAAGFRFESNVRFGAWYEPKTDTDGGNDDETIMFGSD